jgi:hypothetical protein
MSLQQQPQQQQLLSQEHYNNHHHGNWGYSNNATETIATATETALQLTTAAIVAEKTHSNNRKARPLQQQLIFQI